ncbi:Cobyric acid synthase [Acaryochloris thomasi RCC1774]|uniref:Cobyric acid synthase n=1 Tax=Acaryochloris thomasi RCC1774 TaxID=1764569 RepID=A0A2W1JD95_9CYAN|nr:cobyric acid synthase CobQ [Acaryochloris thomasi]PZD71738.1 Cobyric acid synthase [Acaryochloris thomasi RCC1774]
MGAIMVVGTTSHAGKSLLTAVICRLLKRQGKRVTPFKGQNMALNAYVTAAGEEMGHAQAVQAWAAGVEPQVDMNPILLKPQGDMTSQVVLQGKVVGRVQAADYYRDYFDRGWQAITGALERLQQDFDWIVCEGAGSPAEINLKHRDLTNMRVAKHLQAPTLLVADIDRGGVFAHVVGTLALLEPDERALVRGIVINKFRGQRSLLESGVTWLEDRTGIPVVGVIPWLPQTLPAEDSLSLFDRRATKPEAEITIVVIRLPRVANFTDFDPLESEASVNLRFVDPSELLGTPDAVILPGSKTTIADLQVLQSSGMAAQIQAYSAAGGMVLGICGGLQMLGQVLIDTTGEEGQEGEFPGLGLLPLRTEMTMAKITQQRQVLSCSLPAQFEAPSAERPIHGYEIHQGQTQILDSSIVQPLFDDPTLGVVSLERLTLGTYLHGLLDNGAWRRSWLNQIRCRRDLYSLPTDVPDYEEQRNQMFDQVTDAIAEHLDLTPLLTLTPTDTH